MQFKTRHPHLPRRGNDPTLVTVSSDAPLEFDVPLLDLNDPAAIVNFVVNTLGLKAEASPPFFLQSSTFCLTTFKGFPHVRTWNPRNVDYSRAGSPRFRRDKLPQVGSALGSGLRNFKKGLKDEVEQARIVEEEKLSKACPPSVFQSKKAATAPQTTGADAAFLIP